MKIIIDGEAKEIAALAAELRERQGIDSIALVAEVERLTQQTPQSL